VFRDDAGRVTAFPSLSAVAAMHEDLNGDLWFGGTAAAAIERRAYHYISSENFDGGDLVASIYRDRNHVLWIGMGSPNGKGVCIDFRMARGNAKKGCFSTMCDSSPRTVRSLWIGGMEGLARFQDGAFRQYSSAQGLSFNYVRAIYEDEDGALWIGTYGGGLNRLKNGRFVSITKTTAYSTMWFHG